MPSLPANIYSVASVRALDRRAIDDAGVPGYTLMQRAGRGLYTEIRERYPEASRLTVICGAGNNAGDGYVVAKHALDDGRLDALLALGDTSKLSGDAKTAYDDFVNAGGRTAGWTGELPEESDLFVDAILGSGLDRPVEGAFADAIRAINRSGRPLVSADIPSGLHGDSGRIMGVAVDADLTRSFVGLKTGLFVGAGVEQRGDLSFDDLDIPSSCYDGEAPTLVRVTDEALAAALPRRRRAAHKGDAGHVLVVGGGPGMPGAIRLCGEAALRAGAGRVSLATHPSHASAIVAGRPELMCHSIAEPEQLEPLLDKADVVAFGPGLGQGDWAKAVYAQVSEAALASVWDADALNLLARSPSRAGDRIITPHPGEASRLLDSVNVQEDRIKAVTELAERYGGVAVLKGAGTLIAANDATPRITTAGNPGMAVAGMGDVLTGIIAAFRAQGLPAFDAAAFAAHAHALAGDLAAVGGERGMIAGDVIAALRLVLNP